MRVDFQFQDGLSWADVPSTAPRLRALFKFLQRQLSAEAEFQQVLARLGVSKIASVSLRFCDDVEMREVQKEYRNLDRTTDVLSFPSFELPGADQVFSQLAPSELSWGDLLVSLPAVERGARRGRRSFEKELIEVLIHGFLHLLGFDHVRRPGVSAKMAARMKSVQRSLLVAFEKSE